MTTIGHVHFEGAAIHYETRGSGRPVVFVHAGFVDSRMWDPQWNELAERYQVLRYDQLGFGKSDPAPGPVARHKELAAVVRHLEIGRATFVGCSMGGTTVLDFAFENAELVDALVLVSATPSGFELEGDAPPEIARMTEAAKAGDHARVQELSLSLWLDGPNRKSGAVPTALREKVAEMNRIPVERNTYAIADAGPQPRHRPPAATTLREQRARTLVIAGALDHPEILRAAKVMTESMPNARKIVIEGAAHLPSLEKPEEFNRALQQFLA
jgi:pimeloyl-ACP methyl ester carboxylesterase